MRMRVVSVFSGLGGMDLGLIGGFQYLGNHYPQTRYDIVYAMDFDKSMTKIYNKNFKHPCAHEDILKLDEKDVPQHDILIGGFPCQSFSVSAQNPPRLGYKDDRGKLFFEMCRILKHHQPRFFVAENVKGILSANKRQAFPLIIKEFEKSGYYVKHAVINSVDFGVPQKRERVFIIGFKNKEDYDNYLFPSPVVDKPVALKKVLKPESEIEDRYYFSQRAIDGLKASKSYKTMNKGRAQDINQPSNTVSAHLAKVSLNSTDPILFINNRYRMYTPREVARIQSFPETFQLSGVKTHDYRGLGNAVAPVVMWHIGNSLQLLLDKQPIHTPLGFIKKDTETQLSFCV